MNSSAPTTTAVPAHDAKRRCPWIQVTTRSDRAGFGTPGAALAAVVAGFVGFPGLPVRVAVAMGPSRPNAPGVTRTPGQPLRKPLLYPPELQGLVPGRRRRKLR